VQLRKKEENEGPSWVPFQIYAMGWALSGTPGDQNAQPPISTERCQKKQEKERKGRKTPILTPWDLPVVAGPTKGKTTAGLGGPRGGKQGEGKKFGFGWVFCCAAVEVKEKKEKKNCKNPLHEGKRRNREKKILSFHLEKMRTAPLVPSANQENETTGLHRL